MTTKKIYIVFQQWESKHGCKDAQILNVTFDKDEAIKCLREERDEILSNMPILVSEIKNNNDYDFDDRPDYFYLNDNFGGWDEITIIEKDVEIKNK